MAVVELVRRWRLNNKYRAHENGWKGVRHRTGIAGARSKGTVVHVAGRPLLHLNRSLRTTSCTATRTSTRHAVSGVNGRFEAGNLTESHGLQRMSKGNEALVLDDARWSVPSVLGTAQDGGFPSRGKPRFCRATTTLDESAPGACGIGHARNLLIEATKSSRTSCGRGPMRLAVTNPSCPTYGRPPASGPRRRFGPVRHRGHGRHGTPLMASPAVHEVLERRDMDVFSRSASMPWRACSSSKSCTGTSTVTPRRARGTRAEAVFLPDHDTGGTLTAHIASDIEVGWLS